MKDSAGRRSREIPKRDIIRKEDFMKHIMDLRRFIRIDKVQNIL